MVKNRHIIPIRPSQKLQTSQEKTKEKLSPQPQPQEKSLKESDIINKALAVNEPVKNLVILNKGPVPISLAAASYNNGQITITIDSELKAVGPDAGAITRGANAAAEFLAKYPLTLLAMLKASKSKGFYLRLAWYEAKDPKKPNLDVQHHYEPFNYIKNDQLLAFQHEKRHWMQINFAAGYVEDYICPHCRQGLTCKGCGQDIKAHQMELV